MKDSLCRATPVLRAADYPTALAFYRDVLGFAVVEEGGDPPRFGILRNGDAFIFVNAWDGPRPPMTVGWDAYFHVDDIEALLEDLRGLGVEPSRDLTTTEYSMREFELVDPDGNILCFGADA